MPAFASPLANGGLKRKPEDEAFTQRKRSTADGAFSVNAGLSNDTHWMVQW